MTWVWLLWSELPPGKDRPGRRPTGRIAGPSRHLLLGCRVPGAGRSLGPARCDTGPVGTGPMWHRTGYGAVSRPALTPQEPHPCHFVVVPWRASVPEDGAAGGARSALVIPGIGRVRAVGLDWRLRLVGHRLRCRLRREGRGRLRLRRLGLLDGLRRRLLDGRRLRGRFLRGRWFRGWGALPAGPGRRPGPGVVAQGRLDRLQAPLGSGPPGELGPRQDLRHPRGVFRGEFQPDGDRIRLGPPSTCHGFKVPTTAVLTEHGRGCLK